MDGINKPRKSLREVLPKKTSGHSASEQLPDERYEPEHIPSFQATTTAPHYEIPARPRNGRPIKTKVAWIVGILVVVVAAFSLSTFFAQATIKVTPRQGKLLLSGTERASRETSDGGLTFQTMVLEDTAAKVVPATGTEYAETKATGQITIVNTYSTASQELIANTRFETADGRIYRISQAVMVPGATEKGGELTPGTVDATVTADEAGAEYNLTEGEFKIPGFKGGPRYEKFGAKVKTPIAGGFKGDVKSVAAEEKARVQAELQAELKERIIKAARLQLNKDYVLFEDAIFLSFSEDRSGTSTLKTTEAEIREKVVLTGIIFNLKDLARYYALTKIPDYANEEVAIENPSELIFKLNDRTSITPSSVQDISFNLEGNARIVWLYNAEDLKARLRAAPNKDYQTVFAKFPAIEEAEVIFRPPWIRSFPEDPKKTQVVTELTK